MDFHCRINFKARVQDRHTLSTVASLSQAEVAHRQRFRKKLLYLRKLVRGP